MVPMRVAEADANFLTSVGRFGEGDGSVVLMFIQDRLNLIRVYSQPPGKEADRTKPFVLEKGSTVEEFAAQVHHDFYEQMKSARIWGSGAFQGQMVGRDHKLRGGDIIELRI